MGRPVIDETGHKYGRWVVLRRAGSNKAHAALWLCRCDCGTEKVLSGIVLRAGNSRSCGCIGSTAVSELGQQYGHWTVLERAGKNDHSQAMWLCRCTCGTERAVAGFNLRSDNSKSCGCIMPPRLTPGQGGFNVVFGHLKISARQRGYVYELTEEQTRSLQGQRCHYCGAEPGNIGSNGSPTSRYVYQGIDRVDNTQGYVLGNVLPCCKTCNLAKGTMSYNEFLGWVALIYRKHLHSEGPQGDQMRESAPPARVEYLPVGPGGLPKAARISH